MIIWHLEKRKIKDLIPYHKNPRFLSEDQGEHLKKSLQAFGIIEKPICNLDNTLIGGHQRVAILKQMNVKEVECWIPDRMLTAKEIEECAIRLNKNTGDWDWEILANQFEMGDLIQWGFKQEEFLGIPLDVEEIPPTEQNEKDKKKTMCPECGCEF